MKIEDCEIWIDPNFKMLQKMLEGSVVCESRPRNEITNVLMLEAIYSVTRRE